MKTEEAFLSEMDGKKEYQILEAKLKQSEHLTDEELMKLIILPLTFRGIERKQDAAQKAVKLAETITDNAQQVFALSGILSFPDKMMGRTKAFVLP